EIFAAVAEPKAVRLEVMDPGPCERSWHDDQLHAWGSKDVRIVLARALSFELCVVERGTGAAVTQYEVRCHRVKSGSSGDRRGRLPGEHPEGRVTVDHVRRGRNVLRVFPTDKALLPSAGFEFEATDAGVPPIRVEIDRMQPAVVRATTSTSAPVAGSKVEVIAKGSRPPRVGEVLDPRLGMDMGGSSDPKFRYPELRSSGVTDSNGRAAVFVPADDNGLIVRITGAAHPTALVDPARFPPAHELVVVVADGGAINGTVLLHALDRRRVSVHLRRGDTNERPPPHQDHSVLDADGRFVLRGLAPGRYRIDLEYASQYRTGWAGDGAMPVDIKVPEVTVEAGRVSEITVDATAVSPASVRGRVLVNGAPPALVHVFVEREYNMRFGQFVPAADGTFEAADLMPGTYHAGLVVGFTTGEGCEMLQQESFVLAAGQQLVRDFLFVRRRLVVHLLQADGKTPAANVACTCNGEQFFLRRTSDADGRFVVDPAPADAFQVYTGQSGDTSLGQVEVPAGKIEHEVMLTLPATKAK
ncbi:MAG TPA: hypothetical protein VK348_05135, partial [Planctomycetota bacterium]|nr:hypothetical protein [Planctomycetota bacterium]